VITPGQESRIHVILPCCCNLFSRDYNEFLLVSQVPQINVGATSNVTEMKSVVKCIVSLSCNAGCSSATTALCRVYYTSCWMHASLVALKLADALLHLLVGVDAEAVLGDAGQLYVLGIEFLLHDLLESTKSQGLSLLKGQAPVNYISNVDE
jgi:hypothetical protein